MGADGQRGRVNSVQSNKYKGHDGHRDPRRMKSTIRFIRMNLGVLALPEKRINLFA